MREIRSFSLIFADFRFSWELQHFGGADFRRKPQETADFRRKPQETADFRRNPFVPFSQTWCLVAQCSATPATVAATPPCSATPFQAQISVRHLPGMGGGKRCDTKLFRGCGATPVLHLQNAIKSRKSAATRVARHV